MESITEGDIVYNITYGVDNQRRICFGCRDFQGSLVAMVNAQGGYRYEWAYRNIEIFV